MYGLSLLIKHTVLCALPLRARGLDVAVSLPQYFKENGYMTLGMFYIDTQLWVHCNAMQCIVLRERLWRRVFKNKFSTKGMGKVFHPGMPNTPKGDDYPKSWNEKVLNWQLISNYSIQARTTHKCLSDISHKFHRWPQQLVESLHWGGNGRNHSEVNMKSQNVALCAPSWKKIYGNIIEIRTTQTSQNSWQGHCKHGLYDREAEGACSSCTDWGEELFHCLWSAQGDLRLKCSIQSMCFFFSLTSHGIALQNSTISTLRMLLVCPPILMSQRWKILKAEWKIHKSMLRTSRTWPGLVQPAFWTSLIVLPRARAFLI